jgi:regulator of protease activity HflC (stomatin/prohibitin superfamily)
MQDRIRNFYNEAVMGLLFVSLLVIYLNSPPGNLITFLCVVILAISLIVAISSDRSELNVLVMFAALVSLVAAYFWGRNLSIGAVGGVLLPILWLGVLFLFFTRVWRRPLVVPDDRVILIRDPDTGDVDIAPTWFTLPQSTRIVATIPLYGLSADVEVKTVNTKAGHNVDGIAVHTHFNVISRNAAKKVLESYTNRDHAQTDLAKQMGKERDEARRELAFWETLLQNLMKSTVEDVVRDVIFESATNAVDVYNRRVELAAEVSEHLNSRTHQWGVEVTRLDFERVDVADERFKAMKMQDTIERETTLERIKAEREATRVKLVLETEVHAEAHRVRAIIEALRDAGIEITPDVVLKAMRATSDWVMEGDYTLLPQPVLPASPAPPTPKPAEKKDNGAKKA